MSVNCDKHDPQPAQLWLPSARVRAAFDKVGCAAGSSADDCAERTWAYAIGRMQSLCTKDDMTAMLVEGVTSLCATPTALCPRPCTLTRKRMLSLHLDKSSSLTRMDTRSCTSLCDVIECPAAWTGAQQWRARRPFAQTRPRPAGQVEEHSARS
jgi:hypothetical protein